MTLQEFHDMDLEHTREEIISRYYVHKFVKQIFDMMLSVILLVITSPIIFIACILIRIESKGKAIYKQTRYGYKGKEFVAYKLRTMYDRSSEGNLSAPKDGDRRVTKVGKILRKTSIDELPQMLNVLKGDMSILGPRAVPYKEIELRKQKMIKNDPSRMDFYDKAMEIRSYIKPGISGMAQANGRSDLSVELATAYDVYYVLNYSMKLDIDIFIKTLQIVLFRKGVN